MNYFSKYVNMTFVCLAYSYALNILDRTVVYIKFFIRRNKIQILYVIEGNERIIRRIEQSRTSLSKQCGLDQSYASKTLVFACSIAVRYE